MSETNQMLFRRVRQAEQERDEMRRRLEAAERIVEEYRDVYLTSDWDEREREQLIAAYDATQSATESEARP